MSNYRTKPDTATVQPLRGVASRIVAMADAAARGEMADLQGLWRHMQDTDVTVASAVAKRLGYIESLDWEIRTIENTDQILAAEQAAVLRYAYERVQNLQEAAKNIAYANFTGFSILEKIRTGYGPFVKRLEYIPCQYWNYRKDAKQWYFNPEARSGMTGNEIAAPATVSRRCPRRCSSPSAATFSPSSCLG
jgi:phage gp29-like protein